jgi:hypothetical protein
MTQFSNSVSSLLQAMRNKQYEANVVEQKFQNVCLWGLGVIYKAEQRKYDLVNYSGTSYVL